MEQWQGAYSIDTAATPAAIWAVLRDVQRWPEWNAGIERIEAEGPFTNGTWFSMTPPGQDALRSQLTDVRENEVFVDETCVGELLVRVTHRISPASGHGSRITYSVEAQGPDAQMIGPMVSADFPEVLAALAARAEAGAA